jgi:anaerobic magnesium-protoporphyrin IX monomethyl ester cyclase
MKIALVYPYVKNCYTGCNPPISLLYLAASLLKNDYEVKVIDIDEDNQSFSDIITSLKKYSPDLIGIPMFSNTIHVAYKFVDFLFSQEEEWLLVLGGPHPTACAQDILTIFEKCDFVLRGESEDSIVDLVRCIEGNNDFNTVYGLSYRNGNKIIHNPDVVLNNKIDDIPFPARKLLDSAYKKNTYWRIGHKKTTDIIITSRGCPYNCNFCFKVSDKFRCRSPENIIEELIQIRSKGIKSVHIMDDLFTSNKSRCFKILKLINEQKLGMEFKVRARVDLICEELLIELKNAGVKSIVYGIESGAQKMLDLMNKRTTVKMNYNAIALTKKVGLQCYVDVLIGHPGETPKTILETEQLLLKAKPTAVNLSIMYPFPNTIVYNQAKAEGTLMNDWNIDGAHPWIKLPWINEKKELEQYRKDVLRRYLLNPIVIFNVIRLILIKSNFQQLRIITKYFLYYIVKFKKIRANSGF